ncbi:MAG: ParB/RepB/Spo0J family partition protein [Flavobacteriales bacterium]|nr:ParB/RepB/Spo0J family partition protein [Flavobacteriales bacterium]
MTKKSNKKPALGRGLGALLDDVGVIRDLAGPKSQTNTEAGVAQRPSAAIDRVSRAPKVGEVAHLGIGDIVANPDQPRRNFDSEALDELAESIETLGIIQPLTVRRVSVNRYQLISGERRFRAAQIAGLERVPAYIREADDQTMLEMALVENIQREDLNAVEVAITYRRLMQECGLTHEQMAVRLGKGRASISNHVRLLNLPANMQNAIIEGGLSFGHARILSGLAGDEDRTELFLLIGKQGMSVRASEQWVRDHRDATAVQMEDDAPLLIPDEKESHLPGLSEASRKVLLEFRQRFSPKVVIRKKKGDSGLIEIPFGSQQELESFFEALNKRQY